MWGGEATWSEARPVWSTSSPLTQRRSSGIGFADRAERGSGARWSPTLPCFPERPFRTLPGGSLRKFLRGLSQFPLSIPAESRWVPRSSSKVRSGLDRAPNACKQLKAGELSEGSVADLESPRFIGYSEQVFMPTKGGDRLRRGSRGQRCMSSSRGLVKPPGNKQLPTQSWHSRLN